MKKLLYCLLCVFLLNVSQAQTIYLATYQYADNDRIKNIEPLAAHLSQKLGVPVQTKSYPSVHSFIEGIQKGEVDIALINTFGFFLLETASKSYPMEASLTLEIAKGSQNNYTTAIVALKSSPINRLEQIKKMAKDTRLMLVNQGSTSGNLVPRLALSNIGIGIAEEHFKKVSYGKNHKATLDSLLQGKADLVALGSSEYFFYVKNPENASKIKLIWDSPEIPLGPVLFNNRLSKEQQKILSETFLAIHQSNQTAFEAVKNGWSEAKNATKYISINKNYYNPFKKQLGNPKDMQRILELFAN